MYSRILGPWLEDGQVRKADRVRVGVADQIRFKDRGKTVQMCAEKPIVFVCIWCSLKIYSRWTGFCGKDPQAKKAVSAMGVWTPREGSLYPLHSNKRI